MKKVKSNSNNHCTDLIFLKKYMTFLHVVWAHPCHKDLTLIYMFCFNSKLELLRKLLSLSITLTGWVQLKNQLSISFDPVQISVSQFLQQVFPGNESSNIHLLVIQNSFTLWDTVLIKLKKIRYTEHSTDCNKKGQLTHSSLIVANKTYALKGGYRALLFRL